MFGDADLHRRDVEDLAGLRTLDLSVIETAMATAAPIGNMHDD